jgi:hypothetical protein
LLVAQAAAAILVFRKQAPLARMATLVVVRVAAAVVVPPGEMQVALLEARRALVAR